MIGEESWFKSFMGGEKNKPAPPEPDTDSLETTQENSGVDEETDKIRRIREAIEKLDYAIQMREDEEGKLTHAREQMLRFDRRVLQWKERLIDKEKSGNSRREWDRLSASENYNLNKEFATACRRLDFHTEVVDGKISAEIFDDLDVDPFFEISGIIRQKNTDSEAKVDDGREVRLLFQYIKDQNKLEIVGEIPDGYQVQDVHPFGEFVILADVKHTSLSNVNNNLFREKFFLFKIDKNQPTSMQPVMELSRNDSVQKYLTEKHNQCYYRDSRIGNELVFVHHINSFERNGRGFHKRAFKAIKEVIEKEKKQLGETTIETTINFLSDYGITPEEQAQLGIIVNQDAIMLNEYGHTIAMGGLAFSTDGNSLVRVAQTRSGHMAYAAHIIPMRDLVAGKGPSLPDVKVKPLEGIGVNTSIYDHIRARQSEDEERALYRANKKLGNIKI
ncbi:MAG: hypothetical protein GW775_03445 [Candidatus Magasanikbacteria bacterium]|uniref:Uncharacterized protein n=1 Tax=Candidatus Magasanikbacteria bacterium CG10_big_fil_rev_8_21_14_0_10_38_6 TaxID=1974647 RepID=A0A2M6NZK8_9BACT|nr:hypothetical protein [Candidatus Magasanikbacteria bacterium]PIR76915.1 MAG: hypothetical protein COU30_05285 [Candidatus Magasanikbacteria bacterium CG10_big_fil_rev_8_21_14_0_10_38_6]